MLVWEFLTCAILMFGWHGISRGHRWGFAVAAAASFSFVVYFIVLGNWWLSAMNVYLGFAALGTPWFKESE